MKKTLQSAKEWLQSLSFKTGVAVAGFCIIFFILSFRPMLLPISIAVKGTLWAVFYGLAKASQYTAILILGKTGIEKLKKRFGKTSKSAPMQDA